MENGRILLLGGNGFLGTALQEVLPAKDYDVVDKLQGKKKTFLFDIANNNSVEELSDLLGDYYYIVLLASTVGRTNFESRPLVSYWNNIHILTNVLQALEEASLRYKKKFNITFYSSSEVYGETNGFEYKHKPFIIDITNPRSLYMQVKLLSETLLLAMGEEESALDAIKILRPFNVCGKRQKRGFMYDMLKTAIREGIIYVCTDTIRPVTSLNFATQKAKNMIFSSISETVDIVEEGKSFYLEDIAQEIKQYVETKYSKKVFIWKLEPDSFIQFRLVGKISRDTKFLRKIIEEVDSNVTGENDDN
jgi:nucleoside-diphosphate-sugar epimerase